MMVLISYDVKTEDKEGRKRLRKVAKICKNFGWRVQYSVFECYLKDSDLVRLRAELLDVIDASKDSIRIYLLDEFDKSRIEHFGAKKPRSIDEPFIF